MRRRKLMGLSEALDGHYNEARFTADALNQGGLNGVAHARPAGLFAVCVVGTITITAGAVVNGVTLVLEGSNDGTTWFVLTQSTVAERFTATGQTRALNELSNSICSCARFDQLRVRAVNPDALTFTLAVQITGMSHEGAEQLVSSATLTRTGATTNDAAFTRMQGSTFATIQAVMAGIALAGGSFSVRLQGSPDGGTTWITIAQIGFVANVSQLLSQDGRTLIILGGFQTLRFQVADVGAVGGAPAYTVNVFLRWDSADVRAGNDGLEEELEAGTETTELIVQEVSVGGEAANTIIWTGQLLFTSGAPVTSVRRVKLILYDTTFAGDADLAANAVFSAVGTGTALSALNANVLVLDTDAAGTFAVSVLDAAAETVRASVTDDGVPNTLTPAVIVQTIESSLVFAP